MNSTFNSLEAHLLAANEAVNMEDFQKAVVVPCNDRMYVVVCSEWTLSLY
jgi:hypothetical protein